MNLNLKTYSYSLSKIIKLNLNCLSRKKKKFNFDSIYRNINKNTPNKEKKIINLPPSII